VKDRKLVFNKRRLKSMRLICELQTMLKWASIILRLKKKTL